jgi:PadR family transcriptional regulator, regulatory protein PadR
MAPHKELIGASTNLLLLAVLNKQPSYGYEIIRLINERADGKFLWREGTVYPLLHKLEQEGLIRSQWQETETGRKRKYYYITGAGRTALQEQSRNWATFNGIVADFTGASHA